MGDVLNDTQLTSDGMSIAAGLVYRSNQLSGISPGDMELIANLGASKKVPPIAEGEYDNIYVISIPWFGKTKTIRLRFGDPYIAEEAPGSSVR